MRAAGVALLAALASACGGSAPRPEPAPTVPGPPVARVAAESEAEPDSEPSDGGGTDGGSSDGIRVVASRGHMDPKVADAGIAPHRRALGRCYAERVGKRRWLGGQVELRWDVAADGKVSRVLLAASDLGAWPVEKCLLDVARAATFGKPIGGPAELTLPIAFAAQGEAPVWDVEQSAKAVGGQLLKLASCARAKAAAPAEVSITLYVGPQGRAQSVGFASATTALDDAWAACAEKVALGWQLPDPRGQVTKLAVRYRPR